LRDSAFELVLSAEIAAEVLQALEYPKVRKAARSRTNPELWFEDILVLAEIVPGEYRVAAVSTDPDDDKYIGAAIEGRAPFVVSGDPDLLNVEEHEGVRCIPPRHFLDLLAKTQARR
jgi:putative PIN family toxin of toxin-antitoxin system